MARRCFVIGPMKGKQLEVLEWLAFKFVKPLLPKDFTVETPDNDTTGNIMRQVIKACDRADLVVANTTGNNPNVLYEMAVLDAMGRACIPVKINESQPKKKEPMVFDRAAYRWFTVYRSSSRRTKSARAVRAAITKVLAAQRRGDRHDNPLTDFFGVPLCSFSSAYGLARGYYLNLIAPAVDGIDRQRLGRGKSKTSPRRKKKLHVVIPDRLAQASRVSVERAVVNSGLARKVMVPARGRRITLYKWAKPPKGYHCWMDIPTAMTALEDTVRCRLGGNTDPDPSRPEFQDIEADEILQFKRYLKSAMREDDTSTGQLAKDMVEVVRWAETPLADA